MFFPNLATWNVRGFNDSLKVGMCKDLIKSYCLKLVGILEAKVHSSWASDQWFAYSHSLFENENCCDNFSLSNPGRIWIKWDANHVSFSPTFISSQMIHGIYSAGSSPPIFLSVIYAANLFEDRKVLWDNLLMLSHNINSPWVIMGDLNCYRYESEKAGGVSPPLGRLGELNNFVFQCGLHDLASIGLQFTWFNQRVDLPIHIKLDRILVNSEFLDLFPSAYYKIEAPSGSDHSPLILMANKAVKTVSRFLFKNFWLQLDEFWEIMLKALENPFRASPIHSFYKLLRDIKLATKEKNWASSSNLSKAILEAKRNHLHYLNEIQSNPLDLGLNVSLKRASNSLELLQSYWSSWISQRAKAYWLAQGEDDLGFLYAKIRDRKNKNNIKEINYLGRILHSHRDMAEAFVMHFSDLFNAPLPLEESFSNIPIGNKIPTNLVDALIIPISDFEIKEAVFAGKTDSSPGPDGFTFAFYQRSWHIIGYHLCLAVKDFFLSGILPKGVKATAITLIPKSSHSYYISDYRPISLCNVFYKIIAKIIANRLKPIMPHIICENQSGFISKRISTDNIILAAEVLKHFKGQQKIFCAKIDIKKAFDSISREFLLDRLRKKGFPNLFIKWIHGCISDVYFSICLNGSLEGFFKSSSGLRQGCPLSPLLFCIAMDGLSQSLNSLASFVGLKYKNFSITHLMYADDLLVFGEASLQNFENLTNILTTFKEASGLGINPIKSAISFSKAVNNADLLAGAIGITNMQDSFTYLGIPITSQRIKFSHFQPLLSRISALLEGWKVKFLSFAGRVQFIKFTISNTIAYWIRGAIIPKACQKFISRICSKFLFFGNLTDKRLHIISWKNVVKPKIKGGLGIPSLDSLYHGVACSLIWRLYNSKSLLSLWFKENYESPWKPPPPSASKFWKLICNKANTLRDSVSFKVGLNSNLSTFWDPWYYGTSLGSSMACHSRNGCWVKDIILNGVWNLPAGWPIDICGKIKNIGIEEEDDMVWVGVAKPVFKHFTAMFYSNMDNVDWCKFIWHKKHALRYACYAWMAIQGKLKTADSLIRRSIPAPPHCNFCLEHFENHSHLFFGCDFTFEVLSKLLPGVNAFYLRPNLFQVYDFFWNNSNTSKLEKIFCSMTVSVTIYFLWRERNQRRFKGDIGNVDAILKKICSAVQAKVNTWNNKEIFDGKFREILD
ncbi:Putative ribonuclease H protein [Dendrobium catenatum]|uniref:Ribonuclease H protein n=1 Tax=Dendrobium catenatum TaxID=906689 RepID=A0A2I0VPG1_9ASPA|nr:Putative ribonuclease H protein [Dendrobium catenatum]